jgi:hypothetical protein
MTTIRVPALAAVLTVCVAGMASAQPPMPHDMFVSANMAVQPSAQTFTVSARPEIYGESALVNSLAGVDGAGMVDLQGGYRVAERMWVVLGLTSTVAGRSEARVVSQIPDPLLYDRAISRESSLQDLKHTERFAHLSLMFTRPLTRRIDGSALAGPSYGKVFQQLVRNLDVPLGTQNATPIPEEETATKLGFHVGGDLTYRLTPSVGVGVMARFVRAPATLPSGASLKLGGLQYGAGVRFGF